MADTPEVKQLITLTDAQLTTNKELLKVNESIKAMAKAMGAPEQDSPEDKKEKKTHDKQILTTLKGILKGMTDPIKDGSKGLLGGIKKMFTKYKKIIMGLLGAGMLALFATMDMDKLKEIWGKFKEAITAIYDVMMPIVQAIGKWLEEKVLPATFELVMAQLENLTQMFVDIKGHFDGWD